MGKNDGLVNGGSGGQTSRPRFSKWLNWGGGLATATGFPFASRVRVFDMQSWLICLILLLLFVIVLVGISGWNITEMRRLIKSNRLFRFSIPILIGCFVGTGISKWIQGQELNKQCEKTYTQFCNERVAVRNGTIGINEFNAGKYGVAYDSLIRYADSSAVAAYCMGIMLYNGYGLSQDHVAGIKYLERSAEQNYFRAVHELLCYHARIGDYPRAIKYASQFVLYALPRMALFSEEDNKSYFSDIFFDYLMSYEECIDFLYEYYTEISPDVNEAVYWRKKSYKYKNRIESGSTVKEYECRDIAKAYWYAGYTRKARKKMKKIVKKYPNSIGAHLYYAKMLLDIPDANCDFDIENISLSRLEESEEHLLTAIKLAENIDVDEVQKELFFMMESYIIDKNGNKQKKSVMKMYTKSNDDRLQIQYDCASILEKVYRKTGYGEKARNMNHLASDIAIRLKYEKPVQ